MGKDPVVVGIAVRAQHRLQRRVMALGLRKHQNVAVTAVAREMAGVGWANMRAVAQTVEAGPPEGQTRRRTLDSVMRQRLR